jgi:hypothetical protein
MYKLASVALSAALGVAGVARTAPAEADPYISVGIGFPGVAVVAPAYAPAYYGPYYYWQGRYWHRDYDRDRDDRFHGRWDHDRDRGRGWDRR